MILTTCPLCNSFDQHANGCALERTDPVYSDGVIDWEATKRKAGIAPAVKSTSATELEKWEQLRGVVAELLGHDKNWPAHGNGSLAIAASVATLKNRNRRLMAILALVKALLETQKFEKALTEVTEVLKCQQ